MAISADLVRHIASLARLHIPEQEVERYRAELGAMLDYFGQIAAIQTDDVPPTSHVVPLQNVMREDVVALPEPESTTDALARLGPDAAPPFFRVPKFQSGRN